MYGQRIKELRILKGLTQRELAKLIDFKSASGIGMIEREARELSLDTLSELGTIFNVSTDFLLGKTDIDGGYLRLLFAVKMKKKRKRDGLSIDDVCDTLGLSNEQLINLENCILDNLIFFNTPDIAKFIGLTIDDASDLMGCGFPEEESTPSTITGSEYKETKKIPSKFIHAEEARSYIEMHQILSAEGFNISQMPDEDVLDFANEMLNQIKLISYKYKK